MIMWPKLITLYSIITFSPLLIELFLKKSERKKISYMKDDSNYTCTFTNFANTECRQHIYNNTPCGSTCSYNVLQSITNFVASATESVSMCIYLLTCKDICSALINCHKEGKQVRVIVDEVMWGCTASKGRILHKNGVPVKIQSTDGGMMHHKFCLIDENTPNARLFIGTVNITLQGICSNWDTFVYTDNKVAIARLKEEFEEMWSTFHTRKSR